jgi:hypothetical protein
MKKILFALSVFFIASFGCKKPTNEISGEWETVTSVGFKWFYHFDGNGSSCRELPEYFDARFCYDYEITTKTGMTVEFTVQKQEPEYWVWSWVDDCGDIADVTVTSSTGEKQRFILKRMN